MTPAAPNRTEMPADEKRFLERLRLGHDEACEEVLRRITPVIRSGVYSPDDFDDVCQQCILELLEVVRTAATVRSVWGLVQRIAVTTVIDHNRALVRRRRRDSSSAPGQADPMAAIPDQRPEPGAAVDDRDLALYVYQRLGATCRRIVHLVFVQELPYSTAASELGVSEGALRVRIHRCRQEAIRIRDESLAVSNRP